MYLDLIDLSIVDLMLYYNLNQNKITNYEMSVITKIKAKMQRLGAKWCVVRLCMTRKSQPNKRHFSD